MDPYQTLLKPVLFHLDPEVAHNLTIAGMRLAGGAARLVAGTAPAAPALAQTLWGLRFAAPVGLAAGLDKNGVAIAGPQAFFATQDAAESWADLNGVALRSLGVSAITLRDGEHAIYGPTAV